MSAGATNWPYEPNTAHSIAIGSAMKTANSARRGRCGATWSKRTVSQSATLAAR